MNQAPIWKQYGFPSEQAFLERYPNAKKQDTAPQSLSELFGSKKPKDVTEMTHDEFINHKRECQKIERYNNLARTPD